MWTSWSAAMRPWARGWPFGTAGAPADCTPEIMELVDATAPLRKFRRTALAWTRLVVVFSADLKSLLLL
jgi:hypothetical protein